MYINSLGNFPRINSHTQRNNAARLSNTNSFSTAMKNAVENRSDISKTTSASLWNGGVLITEDALERMKGDPEWEQKVIDKIKNHDSNDGTDTAANGLQIIEASGKDSYLSNSLLGQSGLQSYLMQKLIAGQSSLGALYPSLGMSGYYSSGLGSLAASAYGSSINSLINTSLLGSMFI